MQTGMIFHIKKLNIVILRGLATICILLFVFGCSENEPNTLRVSKLNSRYFTDNTGKAIYLTGSHTWNNLIEITDTSNAQLFDFDAYIEYLKSFNHNFVRLWAWDILVKNTPIKDSITLHVFPQPWLRTGPGQAIDGKPKFDLSKFNPEYFERLRDRVIKADDADIYVSVMLFEGFGLQFSTEGFENHPFHPNNNINSILPDTLTSENRMFIYDLVYDEVLQVQQEYVKKVIETVGMFDNVLYEIINEASPASTQWQYHMIDFIKKYEGKRGISHPVGMTFPYKGGVNALIFNSEADWISPNPDGGYKEDPPENNGKKVIISDTDHLWGIGGNRQWVWKSFLRGLNPVFMDPYKGNVVKNNMKSHIINEINIAMGQARKYAEKIDLINTIPAGYLVSSGYCLANWSKEYLIYIPKGDEIKIDLTNADGTYRVEWFDTVSGETLISDNVEGNKTLQLQAPFSEQSLLHLKRVENRN